MRSSNVNRVLLLFLALIVVVLAAAGIFVGLRLLNDGEYEETFDRPGSWGIDKRLDVEGRVENGVYDLLVRVNHGLFLASAGQDFDDGTYEVEATQIDGPLNNGYGMLFRLDETTDSFYAFEISGDGYVWIGRCRNLCEGEARTLFANDWFSSPAVEQGLQATNHLLVVARGPVMHFYVNGVEVGRTSDTAFRSGDIAVMVETLGQRGVRVAFDNFKVTPLEE